MGGIEAEHLRETLNKGLLTDRYADPPAPPRGTTTSMQASRIPDGNVALIDDSQPFPVYGWIDVSWVTPLPAPQLVSPAEGAQLTGYPRTTTLTWQPVAGATGYLVEVEYASTGPAGQVWASAYRREVPGTTVTFDFVGDQPGRWRVSSLDATGAHPGSQPSGWRGFAYSQPQTLATPVQESPADGQNFSSYPRTTTLIWQPVANAGKYLVEVQYGWNTPQGMQWGIAFTKEVAETTVTFDFVGAQPGRWRVTALDPTGAHASSPPTPWRGFAYTA